MKHLYELHEARKTKKDNSKVMSMLSYFASLREWGTVRKILENAGKYTNDRHLVRSLTNLFLLDKRAIEYFGIAEDIVGSMSNMVFGGNIAIKTKDEYIQERIDAIYKDGYFMKSIINAYKAAIATKGRAYLFMETTAELTPTDEKIKDKFVKYTVVPEFELVINNQEKQIIRPLFKDTFNEEGDPVIYRFDYIYNIENDRTTLEVIGYDENNNVLAEIETKQLLGIDITKTEYDFIPFGIVDVGEGMLPNIIFIENSLAENLYFQDEDLANSQTNVYVPSEMVNEVYMGDAHYNIYDKYNRTKLVKGGIDKESNVIRPIQGFSAIETIERNLALNVIQACLDAKINPISIGYLITDRLGNNTDVGADKERASIRLRETHIDKLKPFISKEITKRLWLEGIEVDSNEISIIFAQYITPSIESLTNTLAKQIQFGMISIETAVRKINRDVLSEEEVQREVELIRQQALQIDLNMGQRLDKGVDNRLNSEGIEE